MRDLPSRLDDEITDATMTAMMPIIASSSFVALSIRLIPLAGRWKAGSTTVAMVMS